MIYQGNDIRISSWGMISAIGNDAATSFASARAGISRMTETTTINTRRVASFGEGPGFAHEIRTLGKGFSGYAKVKMLARHALQETMERLKTKASTLSNSGLILVLSDRYFEDLEARLEIEGKKSRRVAVSSDGHAVEDEQDQVDEILPSSKWRLRCHRIASDLASEVVTEIPANNCKVLFGGHATIAEAIDRAVRALASGQLEHVVLGGVDSLVEPSAMLSAASSNVLNTDLNPVGFFPGEAAGFFVLSKGTNADSVAIRGWTTADDKDRFADSPVTGRQTASCMRELADAHPNGADIENVYSDVNGDVIRSKDWGAALCNISETHDISGWRIEYPATVFGETGAAAGFVAVICAAIRMQRGLTKRGSPVLLSLASDQGGRAAIVLDKGLPNG